MIGPRKRIIFWAILVVIAIGFPLLVVEVVLRGTYREEEIDGSYFGIGSFEFSEELGYIHKPGFEGFIFRSDVFEIPVEINHLGLRQKDMDRQLEFPTRVLILGDSFAFGLGVLEEESYPSRLAVQLNKADIGVINGGQSGYSIAQEKIWGIELAEKIQPQVIIVSLYPRNDVKGDVQTRFKNIDVKYGYRLPKDRVFPWPVIDYLRTHSYLWMYVNAKIYYSITAPEDHAAFNKYAGENTAESIEPTMKALRSLRQYCEEKGIIFGIAVIPPERTWTKFDSYFNEAFQEEGFQAVFLGERDFKKTKDYFDGDSHWNESGHAKAAVYFQEFVEFLLASK